MEGKVVISPIMTRTSDKIDPKTGMIINRVIKDKGNVEKPDTSTLVENSKEE